MAVAKHLNIELSEYDERIRTFIPDYEAILDAAADALLVAGRPVRTIVEIGIGTGALAARCLAAAPDAAIHGIDGDEGMLSMARSRLAAARETALVASDFLRAEIPPCDAATASFALHHIAPRRRKAVFYGRLFAALRRGGLLINADCCPASNARIAARDRRAWLAHLERSYTPREAEGFLSAWAEEDHYVRLDDELAMLADAGFSTDVVWRRGSFAVIVGVKR